MKKKLTLLSRYAKDIFLDSNNKVLSEAEGGPAFYLTKILEKSKITFQVCLVEKVNVEILLNEEGEFGRIKSNHNPSHISYNNITSDYLVISTLLDDFDLSGINAFKGKVFLDIQGYVRDGKDFGKKVSWNPKEEIAQKIFCLKGTEEEIQFVDPNTIEKQKSKMLIVTKGSEGCDLYWKGKKFSFGPKELIKTKNTVGAGDSFFAIFVSQFIKSGDPVKSAQQAVLKTSEFLTERENSLV